MMYAACTTPNPKLPTGSARRGLALIILLWMEGFIRFIPIIIGFQLVSTIQGEDFATIHSIIPQFAKIPTLHQLTS